MIEQSFNRSGRCRVLDLGGTRLYWALFDSDWLRTMRVTVTLLNVTASPPENDPHSMFDAVAGDACDLGRFEKGEFDLVHSNSVIEHVGDWDRMRSMAAESMRVGRSIYHQTPYFWFPIEPHFLVPFIHWLPLPVRAAIALRTSLGNWPRAKTLDEAVRAQTSSRLLDKSMMRSLFPDATLEFERVLGAPKSIIAYRAAPTD